VSEARHPCFFNLRPTEKPGAPRSTMNIEMPRDPLALASVFAATNTTSALTPLVMNILAPFNTQ